jgi:hypothetical protein
MLPAALRCSQPHHQIPPHRCMQGSGESVAKAQPATSTTSGVGQP